MFSSELVNYIKKKEQYSKFIYTCPAGKKTIGYGHVVKENEGYYSLDNNAAHNLLLEDIAVVEDDLCRFLHNCKHKLEYYEKEAVLSLLYNWGISRFIKSKLAKNLKEGNKDSAAKEFLDIVNVNSKPMRGLQIRRYEEMLVFKFGWDALKVLEQIKCDNKLKSF